MFILGRYILGRPYGTCRGRRRSPPGVTTDKVPRKRRYSTHDFARGWRAFNLFLEERSEARKGGGGRKRGRELEEKKDRGDELLRRKAKWIETPSSDP